MAINKTIQLQLVTRARFVLLQFNRAEINVCRVQTQRCWAAKASASSSAPTRGRSPSCHTIVEGILVHTQSWGLTPCSRSFTLTSHNLRENSGLPPLKGFEDVAHSQEIRGWIQVLLRTRKKMGPVTSQGGSCSRTSPFKQFSFACHH